ncbi:MAG: arginine repressor [Acidobacteria bacterium]|nr:arginine repressor [Acidobacteriota bacterium]
MKKSKRQQKIIDLITAQNIPTQEDLNELLEKAGIYVNQSSVSRDLDELGVVKINGSYSLPNVQKEANTFGLHSLETAGEILVVAKCEPGLASAVAVLIDREKIAEIVGTIAGDDTIFVAVKDKNDQKSVIRKIWKVFEK